MRKVFRILGSPVFLIISINLNLIIWSYDIYVGAIPKSVKPPVTLPTAIMPQGSGPVFDYCVFDEETRDSSRYLAGTPIPLEPVIIETPKQQAENEEVIDPNPTPEPEPVVIVTQTPKITFSGDDIIRSSRFSQYNFHVVIAGVGYAPDEIPAVMEDFIGRLEANFKGINVDFAYLTVPVEANFVHIDTMVLFEDGSEGQKLFDSVRTVYPVDSLHIGVKTETGLGTSRGNVAIFSLKDLFVAAFIMTHETGHQMSLSDGYRNRYFPEQIPNSELFYADEMPPDLSQALVELGYAPPMYFMGTCNGRALYQFYDTKYNFYGDHNPDGPNPWGDSLFTPLQVIIMNNYVRSLKGGN